MDWEATSLTTRMLANNADESFNNDNRRGSTIVRFIKGGRKRKLEEGKEGRREIKLTRQNII